MSGEESGPRKRPRTSNNLRQNRGIIISTSPRIEVFESFASPEECEHLKQLAQAQEEFSLNALQYAGLVDYRSANIDVELRKSDPVMASIELRTTAISGLAAHNAGDDVMIARTNPWDHESSAKRIRRELQAPLMETSVHPDSEKQPESYNGGVRAVDSDEELDSEGFALRPREAVEVQQQRALMNLHHDHNNNTNRSCTLMLYLSDLPADGCGETFFPAASAPVEDSLLSSLSLMQSSGRYIVQVMRESEERYTVVKFCSPQSYGTESPDCGERSGTDTAVPEGVLQCPEECPGMLLVPKQGRAVLFYHAIRDGGEEAATSGHAWHAPCVVRNGSKWLLTFFKEGVDKKST
ncbi:hypothetical protein CYMTET_16532 [Cymbomonas tetramitiformis]|uniref:Uncharacterized protein n=1 Tax=Cymbomonas tetramitiformis TaxID=36881 RepID=A0AAE0L864_9CHLO|nr:hypothetical protein CYMTET_16532 [Cymbomonas tetramitiformis]